MSEIAHSLIEYGSSVIDIEAKAIGDLKTRINTTFVKACECLLQCKGRIVVTGMGKSGHIARKIAATLASTGSPALYVHPAEACHGDSGMITHQDHVLVLSNSGNTQEILTLLPIIKRLGVKLISLTGNPASPLAQASQIHIDVSVEKEACPLGLAPTASTTAMLAMGDALAVALLGSRGFTAEDFARSHPGGSLGRRLLLRVSDIMQADDAVPVITQGSSLKDALLEMTAKHLGLTAIVDQSHKLLGIFTDGDLRRALEHPVDIQTTLIDDVMTKSPITVKPEQLAAEALRLMESHQITGFIVVDDAKHPVGAFNLHQLLKAGVF